MPRIAIFARVPYVARLCWASAPRSDQLVDAGGELHFWHQVWSQFRMQAAIHSKLTSELPFGSDPNCWFEGRLFEISHQSPSRTSSLRQTSLGKILAAC
jgi:hypothetical protein